MTRRCDWVGADPLYAAYHDAEWGVPQHDPRALWEQLILEGFQAGLSWITILRKRDGFRSAFAGFDPQVIAHWGEAEVTALLQDPGIVRHRGKIEATIVNARAVLALDRDFASWAWAYVDGRPIRNGPETMADVPAKTDLSTRIAKDLKAAGFKFCGPTTVYAWMQASGMVDDHLSSCWRRTPAS